METYNKHFELLKCAILLVGLPSTLDFSLGLSIGITILLCKKKKGCECLDHEGKVLHGLLCCVVSKIQCFSMGTAFADAGKIMGSNVTHADDAALNAAFCR